MAGKSKRVFVILECPECHHRNYTKTKNKQLHSERVSYKKYCSWCKTHTSHKETK